MRQADKRKIILQEAAEGVATRQALMEAALDDIVDMAAGLTRSIRRGGTVYLAGNGGSAADCQHFATELVVRLTGRFERPSLPAISLTADSCLLTAAGNDYGFEKVFSRQVESLVGKKDILLLISTSGNSWNLIEAAKTARRKNVTIYALLGDRGGKLKRYAAKTVIVPSDSVQRIQEEHTFLIHTLVHLIEREIFS